MSEYTFKHFLKEMWNPQGSRLERNLVMLMLSGYIVLACSWLSYLWLPAYPNGLMTRSILALAWLVCLFPYLCYTIVQSHKQMRHIKEELRHLEIQMAVSEQMLKLIDPKGYEDMLKRRSAKQDVSNLFNAKSGPEEK